MNRNRWILLLIITVLTGLQVFYRAYHLPKKHYQEVVAQGTYAAYADYLQRHPSLSERFAVKELLASKWDSIRDNLLRDEAVQSSIVLQEVVTRLDERREKRITISAKSVHRIQDYEDFPEEEKKTLDEICQMFNTLDSMNFPLPSASPPPSMHRFLEREGNETFEEIVADALCDKLNAIAQDSFLQIDILKAKGTAVDTADLHITYSVDNDYELGIPGLLYYLEASGFTEEEEEEIRASDERFLGYILDFQVTGTFIINSQTVPFEYLPTDRAPNIQSIHDGYQYLCKRPSNYSSTSSSQLWS